MKNRMIPPAALLVLTSCSTYHYAPNLPSMPLFREKGEVRATVGYGDDLSGEVGMLDIQAAMAVTNGLAVQVNYGEFASGNGGNYIELAAGHYRPVDKHGSFEVYGGAGYGTIAEDEDLNSHYFKLMAQPSFGYTSRNFEAAVGLRLAYLNHPTNELDHAAPPSGYGWEYGAPVGGSRYLVEPAIMLRAGIQACKLQVSYVYSNNMSAPLDMVQQNFNVGLVFNLGTKAFPRR